MTFCVENSIFIIQEIGLKDVDEMFQIIVKLIALCMVFSGVILIYDARLLTKKFFGFGDQNEASQGLKILGFIIFILGGLILFFNR